MVLRLGTWTTCLFLHPACIGVDCSEVWHAVGVFKRCAALVSKKDSFSMVGQSGAGGELSMVETADVQAGSRFPDAEGF